MKLRNKKTGEIWDIGKILTNDYPSYDTLEQINEEWEDYEEPKEHYEILAMGAVMEREDAEDEIFRNQGQREIGNYFESREEAEKAVEKLKAWKRLKDKGFKVDLWDYDGGNYQERIKTGRILFRIKDYEENDKDLDLLFGGGE